MLDRKLTGEKLAGANLAGEKGSWERMAGEKDGWGESWLGRWSGKLAGEKVAWGESLLERMLAGEMVRILFGWRVADRS